MIGYYPLGYIRWAHQVGLDACHNTKTTWAELAWGGFSLTRTEQAWLAVAWAVLYYKDMFHWPDIKDYLATCETDAKRGHLPTSLCQDDKSRDREDRW